MLSPAVASDPVTSTNTHNSSASLHTPSVLNNISGHGSAILQPGANGTHAGVAAPARDVIREGKEKARAVMAASGIYIGANTPTRASTFDGASVSPITNGVAHGRKRSRSGSPRPLSNSRQANAEQTAADDHGRYLLTQYRIRDQYKSAHISERISRQEDLQRSKLQASQEIRRLEAPPKTSHEMHQRVWDAARIYGGGFEGWGNGWTVSPQPVLMYPHDPQKKWPGHKTRHDRRIRFNRKQLANQAEQLEDLVPIRLDIEHDKIKLRDTFTWNLHERIMEPRVFAETLVEDFKIPQEHLQYVSQEVYKTIQESIIEYYPHIFLEENPDDPSAPDDVNRNDEMRIVIKLNITIGAHTLVDQFEWDINNPDNDPEAFAKQLAIDMALSGEFTTAIAHQIREQVQMFTKSLYITGHPFDGRPVEDSDVRDNFLPSPINSVFRPVQSAKDFHPFLYELKNEELNQQELSILREQRRQKRSTTRRGGPALPDLKDRERTVRSLIVSTVLPGAADSLENARVFKYSRASGRRKGGNRTFDGSDSEESESEESEAEEVTQITGGTARTRGIRGAASAAQAAMRATLGRSQTPEVTQLETQQQERRATSRSLRYEMREESVPDPTTMIVKLKINPTKFRAWLRTYQARPSNASSTPHVSSQTGTPQQHGQGGSSMPPPPSPAPGKNTTPRPPSRSSSANETKWRYHPDGSVDAPDTPPDDDSQIPPPPTWLTEALSGLSKERPRDSFEGFMKLLHADRRTGHQLKPDELQNVPKEFIMQKWFPRIRCNDCPGKSYNAKPADVVQNFMVHLNNRKHRDQVEARIRNGGRAGAE
ncbi:uncharacterized protein PV09_03456 [Verruconis gallopava]|uniref:SNF5-domain-containing protein n=1 Tax=Verruconis gallopava TaxID=253628 RepID=A0A0D1XS76_9PEZI|nr:uncharacterized protein PV09_03456 [Verruconis gallopava]KIW05581.1 hypothetical protein PV09_03456 [Verruconis gallopava]